MSNTQREQIDYNGEAVPIYRQTIAEIYLALQPPKATPYVVAPHEAEPNDIVQFFADHIGRLEYLRDKMRKRFEKSSSEKCGYQTGDIAYVMGRPFMLEVNPTGRSKGVRGGSRGRANVTYNIDIAVSLMSLYVIKTKDYDQCKSAFLIYGRAIVTKNATMLARRFYDELGCEETPPVVRMRAKRGEFAKVEAGALWVSEDIVPYPVDCLAYAVGRAIGDHIGVEEQTMLEVFARVIPGYKRAAELLATRAKPYSLQ